MARGYALRFGIASSSVLVLLAAGLIEPRCTDAANVNATWFGGTGNWSTAADWSGSVVPNNGADSFSVFIDGGKMVNSVVTLDINPTITNLTIDSGDQLNQNDNKALAITGGTATINGTWSLNSAGSNTDIVCSGNATLSGSGSIVMSDSGGNRIYPGDNSVC